jgi:hypothetical protein
VRTQCSSCPCRHLPRRRPPRRLCPLHGGSIASSALRKHTRKKKSWRRKAGGKLTYITCQKQDTWVLLIKNLTLRGSRWEPRSFPREEKSTSPLLLYIYYKLLNTTKEKKELLKLKLQQPLMATSDEVLLKHVNIPSVRLLFAAQPMQLECCFVRCCGRYKRVLGGYPKNSDDYPNTSESS